VLDSEGLFTAGGPKTRLLRTIPPLGHPLATDSASFLAIIEHAGDTCFAKRRDRTVLRPNAGVERGVGYAAARKIGWPAPRLFSPNQLLRRESIARLELG
jgi:hypothetical protein